MRHLTLIIIECPMLMTHRHDIFKLRFLPQYFQDWNLHQMMLYLSLRKIADLEEEEEEEEEDEYQ